MLLLFWKLAFKIPPKRRNFTDLNGDGSESRDGGDGESRGRRVGFQGECAPKVLPPRMEHREVAPRRHRFECSRLRRFLRPQNQIHCNSPLFSTDYLLPFINFCYRRIIICSYLQLDKYQEQGQLLEPYLETIVSPLMNIIRSRTIELGVASDEILEIIKPICIIVYSLVTVCGYKSVIKFFPHQVSDLELAVSLLEKCHHTNSVTSLRQESTGEMEAKCVTLLWLYILVLVPFDISTVDTSIANDDSLTEFELSPLVLRIIGFCKDYLSTAGPMRTMAGLVLSRLLTRPDMPKAFTRFISVCFVACLALVKFSLRLRNIFVLSHVVVLFV